MQAKLRLQGVFGVIGFLSAFSVSAGLGATEFSKGGLLIDQPHAMATAPGQPHGAVFFKSISNQTTQSEQLIGGRAAIAKSVEVHRMDIENNVMRMREIKGIELPANSKVMLGRGNREGYHLMLMNLKSPLKEGERFPVTLIFRNAGEVEVTVTVEKPAMHMHGGHKH
jgi:periplasmic copper chaperone A